MATFTRCRWCSSPIEEGDTCQDCARAHLRPDALPVVADLFPDLPRSAPLPKRGESADLFPL